LRKQVWPPPFDPAGLGEVLTYTLQLIAPSQVRVQVHDPLPVHTTYVTDSLSAPYGVYYDPAIDAITGTLWAATSLKTISIGARVEITGAVESGPLIVNRACLCDEGTGEPIDCDEVQSYTYVYPAYLPFLMQ
jgi:uncharacterized repeat protein (TIGR01451 family)